MWMMGTAGWDVAEGRDYRSVIRRRAAFRETQGLVAIHPKNLRVKLKRRPTWQMQANKLCPVLQTSDQDESSVE